MTNLSSRLCVHRAASLPFPAIRLLFLHPYIIFRSPSLIPFSCHSFYFPATIPFLCIIFPCVVFKTYGTLFTSSLSVHFAILPLTTYYLSLSIPHVFIPISVLFPHLIFPYSPLIRYSISLFTYSQPFIPSTPTESK